MDIDKAVVEASTSQEALITHAREMGQRLGKALHKIGHQAPFNGYRCIHYGITRETGSNERDFVAFTNDTALKDQWPTYKQAVTFINDLDKWLFAQIKEVLEKAKSDAQAAVATAERLAAMVEEI